MSKSAGSDAIQQAVNRGMMIGTSEFINPGAMMPSSVYVVMEPGPNGARKTDRKTSDREEATRWAEELLARTDWSSYTKGASKTAADMSSKSDEELKKIVDNAKWNEPGDDYPEAAQDEIARRKNSKESTMTTQHTEADLLAKMAGATTMSEQTHFATLLQKVRDDRRDQIATEGSLNWDAMGDVDLRPQYAPTFASTASMGQSAGGLDWLSDMVPDTHDISQVSASIRAEATIWYRDLWDQVKQDPTEVRVQTHNAARRTASIYGGQADQAASVFIETVSHLHHKEAEDKMWGGGDPFDQPDEKVQAPPYQMDNGSKLPNPDDKSTFDEKVNGPADASKDPKTDTGMSPSLKEGDSPEGDKDADGTKGEFEDTDRGTHDKSTRGEFVDALPTGGTGSATKQSAKDTGSCSSCGKAVSYDKDSRSWSHDDGTSEHAAKTSARKTAISVTNVGIEGDHGVGTANGTRIKFRLTPKELSDLKSVLYSDLAMNFSGVDIEQSDIIKDSAKHASDSVTVAKKPNCDICKYVEGKDGVEADYDGATTQGPWANMCERHFQSHGVGLGTGRGQRLVVASATPNSFFATLRNVFADTDPKTDTSDAPSLAEGDAPEGDHAASPIQDTPAGDLDASTWGLDPDALSTGGTESGNPASGGPMAGTPTTKEAGAYAGGSPKSGDTAKCHKDGGAIQFFDGQWMHLKGTGSDHNDVYPNTPKEQADADAKKAHLHMAGDSHSQCPNSSGQSYNKSTGDCSCGSNHNQWASSGNPGGHKGSRHTAGMTCSVCGDSIEKDPAGEANAGYHHSNGEKHDHEAKPGSDDSEGKSDNPFADKTSSLKDLGQRIATQATTSNVITFGQALSSMASLNDTIDAFTGHDIVRMVLASNDVPSAERAALEILAAGGSPFGRTADRDTSAQVQADTDTCATCGAPVVGIRGNWEHDPRHPSPSHPDGSVAGDAHAVKPSGQNPGTEMFGNYAFGSINS